MKNNRLNLTHILFTLATVLVGCAKDECGPLSTPGPGEGEFPLGWNENDEQPDSIQVFLNGFGDCDNLPASVSLVSKFPPIGQQGEFGTCVAWAVGYNGKTALEGISKGLSASQLSQAANQISPKDLFYAIPDNQKGVPSQGNCHGTQFYYALDVMQKRGAATLQTVPYNGLGDCSSSNVQQAWTSEAGQHKIKYYRRIDQDVCAIKEQLAANNPVFFGATVGSNFQALRDDRIFKEAPTGNAGGHAMVIAGYDDSRQAFRIVNSWGTAWGDQGYAWVDYNFMVSQFISDKNLYIAVNEDGNVNPPNVDPNAGGPDIASWVFADFASAQPNNPTLRQLDFNIYNIGTAPATASDEWSFIYLYYNAYDANESGILFWDGFNETVLPGTYQYDPFTGNTNFNFDIAPGNSFTNTVFGKNSITRDYTVPPITGFYYLLLVADVTNTFNEKDEFNNLFYTTWQTPKWFSNGYSPLTGDGAVEDRSEEPSPGYYFKNKEQVTEALLRKSPFNSAVNERYPNAYRPEEIIGFFKKQKENGDLERMKQAFKQRQSNNKSPLYRTE